MPNFAEIKKINVIYYVENGVCMLILSLQHHPRAMFNCLFYTSGQLLENIHTVIVGIHVEFRLTIISPTLFKCLINFVCQ